MTHDPVGSNSGEDQRHGGKCRQQVKIKTWLGVGIGDYFLHCFNFGNGNVPVERMNRALTGAGLCGRLPGGADDEGETRCAADIYRRRFGIADVGKKPVV